MKKIITMLLFLCFVLGSLGLFAQEAVEDHSFLSQLEDLETSVLRDKESIEEIQQEALQLEYLTQRDRQAKELAMAHMEQEKTKAQKVADQASDQVLSQEETSGEEVNEEAKAMLSESLSADDQVVVMAMSPDRELRATNLFGISADKVNEKITLDFDNVTLQEALRIIGEGCELNIVVDPILKDKRITLFLKDVTVLDAFDLIFQSHDLSFTRTGGSIFVSSKNKIANMASMKKVIRLKNISAENAQKLIKEVAKSVTADRGTNSLLVTGTATEIAEIEDIISQIDVSRRQVLLITQVLEVSRDSSKELGVDWSDSLNFSAQEIGRPTELSGNIASAKDFFSIGRLERTPLQLAAIIGMLIDNNKAKILSNPRIVTMSGEESSIFVGDRIPYEVTKITGGVSNTEVEFVEAGIRLLIKPSIIEDDYVVVNVKPEVSSIYAWAGENGQYPWVRTREASASVKVRNGEPFIIGGLISEEERKGVSKLPLLGDLPWLGKLFRAENTTMDTKEIIITVIPHIMTD